VRKELKIKKIENLVQECNKSRIYEELNERKGEKIHFEDHFIHLKRTLEIVDFL